jgi:2-polyprenyl-6-methoxyphenol hydroxylase-like FAD-dependent oxidoreductase
MSPAGGVGAIIAIHDAVTLANWLSTLQMATDKDVREVFKEYRAERYPVAKEAFESSQMFIRNLGKVQ